VVEGAQLKGRGVGGSLGYEMGATLLLLTDITPYFKRQSLL
jgi:hypothetical protein